ncbi:hypothetical protein Dsin_016649 [Dipteronia sinensis]|uniref:Uncharacterized protein n=1 Tax=Dipteronia sinensis TaxID=43782 RepID=A0AAE0E759_9ROSI|nr:hypothetical protein Dsin_016649 [Dipteronia sinensis]
MEFNQNFLHFLRRLQVTTYTKSFRREIHTTLSKFSRQAPATSRSSTSPTAALFNRIEFEWLLADSSSFHAEDTYPWLDPPTTIFQISMFILKLLLFFDYEKSFNECRLDV